MNAYLDFLTSAILTPKSNIADEGIPSDPLTLKQQGEWIIHDLSAGTRQAQVGVTLVLGFGNGPGAPVVSFHRARDHGSERVPPLPLLGEGTACEEIRQGLGVSAGRGRGADREKARKHRLPKHQLMGHDNEEVGMGFLCLGRHCSSRLRAESRYLHRLHHDVL